MRCIPWLQRLLVWLPQLCTQRHTEMQTSMCQRFSASDTSVRSHLLRSPVRRQLSPCFFRARIFTTTITREYQLSTGRDAGHGTHCVQGVHVPFSLRAFRNVSKFMALYSFEPQSYGSHKIASLSSFFATGLQDGGVASRQTESQDQC